MTFKQKPPATPKAESPRALYAMLPRRPFPSPWGHQERILDNYAKAAADKNRKDFALELGTGSGKTLVGLLIGEYHRRDSDSRVVYLCSTNQLVYQTTARAKEYGVPAIPFVGTKKTYTEADLAAFQRGASIAITSYAGLFNAGPGLNDPEVIICDDAHAGESYVAAMWSLRITTNGTDKPIFQALLNFFGELVKPEMRHVHGTGSSKDVDLIPLPTYADRLGQLQALLDVHCFKKDTRDSVKFPWIAIKAHLTACCIYVSPGAFLIRPLIPPTYSHAPFADARHRVYMSATLGEDGDLERMYGTPRIQRIYSDDVREANTGRRLILFPGMMKPEGRQVAQERAIEKDHRVLLVTAGGAASRHFSELLDKAGHTVLDVDDIESDMSKFSEAPGSVALVLANRFDGIDLPGDTCRRLVVVGVPGALNLQETFLRERLGAHAVLRNRVRVRFTQALGRCTRDPSDFALVYCVGRDLLKWCSTRTNSEGLSPELQAELEFGLRQSENLNEADAREYLDAFFGQTDQWRDADASIRADAKDITRKPSDSSGSLATAVEYEIRYVQDLWKDDPVQAHENAAKVSDILNKAGLKPYRAFWEYLAASAADAAHRASGDEKYHRTFLSHVQTAARLAGGVRWLAALSFAHPSIMPDGTPFGVSVIETLLEEWQIRGSKFERSVSEARENINKDEAAPFQRGLAILGRMLGFQTKQHDGTGAPDGVWWTEDGHFYDFEAKSKEKPEAPISFDTVRQAMVHPEWLSQNDKELPPVRETTIVVVSPRSTIQDKAAGIAKDARYMSLVDARTLFDEAASVLNEIRSRAIGLDEETLQEVIVETYHKKGLMGDSLKERIAGTRLRSLPIVATT